jgi:S1-C subfamily serine protease
MAEPVSPLIACSDHAAALVESASASIVAVHSGGRWSSSGIHWRPNVIVTAEEVLERDEELTVTLPGGGKVAASLAGRDPSTDVAALRIATQGLPIAATADAGSLRSGHVILAVGNFEGGPTASFGVVGFVGSAWQSLRGGTKAHYLSRCKRGFAGNCHAQLAHRTDETRSLILQLFSDGVSKQGRC